jgi:two-component system sensor histidine kinase KdpD
LAIGFRNDVPNLSALLEKLRAGWVGYAVALGAVALVSLFIGFVLGQVTLANASMLYLIAVLATAVGFGRGPAVFGSVVAFLTFDWFFVPPLHQWTVGDPAEWLSLLLFLLTAIVTGQLAAGQRERAREAQVREREALLLYDVVRLMGDSELDAALEGVADRLRRELNLVAVGVELLSPTGEAVRIAAGDAEEVRLLRAGGGGSTTRVLQGGQLPLTSQHATPGRWVRIVRPTRPTTPDPDLPREGVDVVPVKLGDSRAGSLFLVHARLGRSFTPSDDRLLSTVAAQLGHAMERDRLRTEATEAEILRRTDQLRSALLSAVSHDLRTPLASIMASAGSLRQPDIEWTSEERLGFAQAIEEEAERLNRIVGNLLDLSRIEAGSLRPEKGWYDLGALVDDVVARLRSITAHHRVHVTVPDDLPPLLLDYVEIDEVIYNLVENAAKYAPPETQIDIEVRRDDGVVQVTVADRGPGMPSTALVHLFEPFYRVVDNKPHPKGLGLGLAVVKGLVEAHGGRVWAENRAGGGARFVFVLPTTDPPADIALTGEAAVS